MAFTRPTLSAIITRIEADISSRLLDGGPVLRRSFLGVLARVFAGVSHMLYGFLEWMSAQIVPGAETNDADYLEAHADTWGITRRAAVYATGNVDITGTDGSVVPVGELLQRADGVEYRATAEATISSGVAVLAVQASVAGVAGNAVEDTPLAFVSALTGINQAGTVATGGLVGGVDGETDAELRARLQARLVNTPQGGALLDYERWALDVSGVYKAFVFPLYDEPNNVYPAPGHVGVTCITTSGVPDAGVISALQSYLDEVAPVTADVTAYAPTETVVGVDIHLSPDSSAIRAAVEAEIAALFDREGAPNSTIYLSHINEAISMAAGEVDHTLVLPISDVVTTRKQYPVPAVSFS